MLSISQREIIFLNFITSRSIALRTTFYVQKQRNQFIIIKTKRHNQLHIFLITLPCCYCNCYFEQKIKKMVGFTDLSNQCRIRPEVIKLFFMLNSAEHEIILLINVEMPIIAILGLSEPT